MHHVSRRHGIDLTSAPRGTGKVCDASLGPNLSQICFSCERSKAVSSRQVVLEDVTNANVVSTIICQVLQYL
jgi:hypothetical protein